MLDNTLVVVTGEANRIWNCSDNRILYTCLSIDIQRQSIPFVTVRVGLQPEQLSELLA